eukprot:TRINITY_DN642_c0_g2_i5.p1 TRINITY_DN642_c0_g2~~TRINITY_DN642_c0_g2_i5.p1  ORF type:complete len:152 (-),score=20.90 TRINITY_DN642_c0_g2_i5:151-606(-)
MDNPKISKKNWYFFRKRLKQQKVAFRQQCALVLKVFEDISFLRFQLNSTTHSLSIILSQKASLHNAIDKTNYRYCISCAQVQTQLKVINNLKSQIQLLHKRNPTISQNLSSPSLHSSPKRKKRKLYSPEFLKYVNEFQPAGTDKYEDLDLF